MANSLSPVQSGSPEGATCPLTGAHLQGCTLHPFLSCQLGGQRVVQGAVRSHDVARHRQRCLAQQLHLALHRPAQGGERGDA